MPKAIVSVHDKSGLVDLAQGLLGCGWDLIASGGTARLLREAGLVVEDVAEYTGSPEILEGRVKTLHPAVHGGILARDNEQDRQQLADLGWGAIDMVVVNLYPFAETIARPNITLPEIIENIDIGGVTLIRAAAKNFERVTLLCDPSDYQRVLGFVQQGEIPHDLKRELALKGFQQTARYDSCIANYFSGSEREELILFPVQNLRYGENPHQKASLYGYAAQTLPLGGEVLQGKELSYTNLLDLDAAWRAAVSFSRTTICIVKHLSPCGLASANTVQEAYQAALASDPVSAFGGVVACNRIIDARAAEAMMQLFLECVIAPGFDDGALEIFSKKKNCRLVQMPDLEITPEYEYRSVLRGVLKQEIDSGDPIGTEWHVVSQRKPSVQELEALTFAWKACQHVKSNAIVLAQGEATVGIGGGQPNRVDCVRMAIERAGEKSKQAVMASDAFFPFDDSVRMAAQAGITAIIQPGGSVRDADSITAADQNQIAMVMTGVRHFRH